MLDTLVAEGGDPAAIVEAEGLGAIGGGDELRRSCGRADRRNPDVVERLKGGNMKAIGRRSSASSCARRKGRADGGEVTRLVREQLGL